MIGWQDLAAIPGFVPKAEVGSGGQGVACRGDLAGADVVIKVLNPAVFNAVAWKHAEDAATLRHPNVVPIEAADRITIAGQDYHYIVMPYIDGRSLSRELAGGRPSLDTAVRWAAQLADALEAFHALQRIHRDVKPDNVMVDAADNLVLIDLELVRYDEFPTVTGRWMLSQGYAAPEHAVSNQSEVRSDLFSLGIVIYEMLAGHHPFGAGSGIDRQNRINAGELPQALAATVPGEIASLVRRLLAPRLLDRPRSASAIATALRAYRPARRLLGEIGVGIRVSQAKTLVAWAVSHERLDLVVVNASPLGRSPSLTQYRPDNGRLLIDPNTDLFAAGQARDRFPESARHWGWAPAPLGNALRAAVDDDALAASILGWQARHGADALISPYIRLERWTASPPPDLERTTSLAAAAVKVARRDWPQLPLLVGVAIPRSHFMSASERAQILTALTGLAPAPDGVYVVIQGDGIDKAFLAALKDTGGILHTAGLEAILAYAGPELVPLLASGSWDAVVTGPSLSHRSPSFKLQTGGPNPRDRYKWVLAKRLLEDFRDAYIARIASQNADLIRCGCDGCAALISTAGAVNFDATAASRHYVSALTRYVAGLRRLDPGARPRELATEFDQAIAAVDRINAAAPAPVRIEVKRRLSEWKAALL